MKKSIQKQKKYRRPADPLQELQRTLVILHDELSETMAWTALFCDGLCGILAENASDIDAATHTGARFAASWLKQRNEKHAVTLQAVCTKLHEIRG